MADDVRARLGEILAPIVAQFADDLIGATDAQIEQLCTLADLERLPDSVDAYMRLLGADPVTSKIYQGTEHFRMDRLLVDTDWKEWAIAFGVDASLLEGAISYTATAEHVAWLGPDRPPSERDLADPRRWSVIEDGSVLKGQRFLDDLETRIPFALENLYWLRRRVDDGIPFRMYAGGHELGSPEFERELQEHIEYMRSLGVLPTLPEQGRQRDIDLRRRLKD